MMSLIQTLSLKNAAGTAIVFNREVVTGNGVRLRDAAATVFSRATRILVSTVLPSEKGSVVKGLVELEYPIFDATTGVLKYTFRHGIGGTYVPKDSTAAERKDFRAMVTSFYASDIFIAQIENMDVPS